jgi:hypothetical protein
MTPPPAPDFSQAEQDAFPDSPTLVLGATGLLDCKIWSTDFRERLAEDDPLRQGFASSQSPADGSSASVKRLEKLHNVALLLTTIDR